MQQSTLQWPSRLFLAEALRTPHLIICEMLLVQAIRPFGSLYRPIPVSVVTVRSDGVRNMPPPVIPEHIVGTPRISR